MYSFEITCSNCSKVLMTVNNASADAWKQDASKGGHLMQCTDCGDEFATEDDGIPSHQGGGVRPKNVSRPKITTLDVTSGSVEGGTTVTITGRNFTVETPTVSFGNSVVDSVNVVDDNTLVVETPPIGTNPVGPVNVVIQNSRGKRDNNESELSDGFEYVE